MSSAHQSVAGLRMSRGYIARVLILTLETLKALRPMSTAEQMDDGRNYNYQKYKQPAKNGTIVFPFCKLVRIHVG
jgi:hypothetical protein